MAADDATDIVGSALRLSRRDVSRATDLSDGLYWLNEGHRKILKMAIPWDFMEVTGQVVVTPGDQRYTFSSLATALSVTEGIDRILGLVNDSDGGSTLQGLSWKSLERGAWGTQADPGGSPLAFTQIGLGSSNATVLLYPTPDQAYTIGVLARKRIPLLTGGDFPLIPAELASSVLTPYIAARMWEQHAGFEAAQESNKFDGRYVSSLRDLIEAHGSAREEETVLVEPGLFDYLEPNYLY